MEYVRSALDGVLITATRRHIHESADLKDGVQMPIQDPLTIAIYHLSGITCFQSPIYRGNSVYAQVQHGQKVKITYLHT
jgi:uncharacterized OB-fold protein